MSEERNILFTSATAMFLISFVMSLFSKSFLTVNFDKGMKLKKFYCYKFKIISYLDELINLTHSVNEFLKSKGLNELEFDARDGFSLIFFVVFSLVFSVIGSSFLFPIFQYASLYTDIAQQCISPIERYLIGKQQLNLLAS